MFIMNYQKLSDNEIKTDTNFHTAYETLLKENKTLSSSSLIGAAQKPLGLGFVYHIFSRLSGGSIIRSEVFLELYTLKATVKNVVYEDFKSGFVSLSQQDKSSKKIVSVLHKQASKPSLQGKEYQVQSIEGKDFIFGKLYKVTVSFNGKSYTAFEYHDESSEEVLLLNWAEENKPTGCASRDIGDQCSKCVEGYTPINGMCTYGCGVLCKSIEF